MFALRRGLSLGLRGLSSRPAVCAAFASAASAAVGSSADCASWFSQGSSMPTSGWTLTYFPVPGMPGEVQRILLALSGWEWKDERVPGSKWPAIKPTTKYGQMPVLTNADGKSMSQSHAMSRYLAKGITVDGAKLYPDDAWLAFQVDEFID